jgi:hypothetical protein
MADFVFNQGLGRVVQLAADAADLRLLVLKTADSDAVHKDADTVAALLATAAEEADFTNYSRKVLAGVAVTVDDAGDVADVDCDDVVFTAAGGASNNTTTDVVIYLHGTNDGDSVPLVQLDAVFTTDGNDVTLQMHADGFFGAS